MNCLINTKLLDTLIRQGCITHRTEIDAYYRGEDMAGNPLVRSRGTFIILEIERLKSGDYRLKCADCYDGSLRMIQGSMIYMIDGMTPERFALTFNLSPTGEPVRLPKRRGRKPSKKQMEM